MSDIDISYSYEDIYREVSVRQECSDNPAAGRGPIPWGDPTPLEGRTEDATWWGLRQGPADRLRVWVRKLLGL